MNFVSNWSLRFIQFKNWICCLISSRWQCGTAFLQFPKTFTSLFYITSWAVTGHMKISRLNLFKNLKYSIQSYFEIILVVKLVGKIYWNSKVYSPIHKSGASYSSFPEMNSKESTEFVEYCCKKEYSNLLSCYHSARKAQVTKKIFKLSLVHASVVSWIRWIRRIFGFFQRNSIGSQTSKFIQL